MAGFAARRCAIATSMAAAALLLAAAGRVTAQGPPVHYRYNSESWPPGAVGQAQLQRGGPIAGTFQPVEIRGPHGLDIWLAEGSTFQPPQPAPAKVGMLVGRVYRFKVTGIPLHPGAEVYPTLEIVDRLYAPAGTESRHPIPIELTKQELELALVGKFVTRVIYLEDPDRALAVAEDETTEQRFYEIGSDEDPLQVADQLGRPMAILRFGSRLPGPQGPDATFLYGSPPLVRIPEELPAPPAAEVTAAPPRRRLPGSAAMGIEPPTGGLSLRELFPYQRTRH